MLPFYEQRLCRDVKSTEPSAGERALIVMSFFNLSPSPQRLLATMLDFHVTRSPKPGIVEIYSVFGKLAPDCDLWANG